MQLLLAQRGETAANATKSFCSSYAAEIAKKLLLNLQHTDIVLGCSSLSFDISGNP